MFPSRAASHATAFVVSTAMTQSFIAIIKIQNNNKTMIQDVVQTTTVLR